MNALSSDSSLLLEVRELIAQARGRAVASVNAEISLLYWRIGNLIHQDILRDARAEYGQGIIAGLARALTQEFGRGFDEKTSVT